MFAQLRFLRSLRAPAATLAAIALAGTTFVSASPAAADQKEASFPLVIANQKLLPCLARFPDDPTRPPTADVTVSRGDVNDTLRLKLRDVKPDLNFDLFTVQRSNKRADGSADPNFKNFGLAWYQSDIHANDDGQAQVTVKTILLDQIFGFDPDVSLAPLNTFNVGFWFNDPNDAAACGFDVRHPTPFNGEHRAGPLAMISLPSADTGLGPLCTQPDLSVSPPRCDP
jgi:hypothetical protein